MVECSRLSKYILCPHRQGCTPGCHWQSHRVGAGFHPTVAQLRITVCLEDKGRVLEPHTFASGFPSCFNKQFLVLWHIEYVVHIILSVLSVKWIPEQLVVVHFKAKLGHLAWYRVKNTFKHLWFLDPIAFHRRVRPLPPSSLCQLQVHSAREQCDKCATATMGTEMIGEVEDSLHVMQAAGFQKTGTSAK